MVNQKKTVIQNEQQPQEAIINEIIKIMAKEKLTIEESNKVLYETSKKISQQTVQVFL